MLTHDIFYNRQRSGYEELFSYMPKYYRQILEMRANISFAGYTVERMADALEQFVLDQFFDTCSEDVLEEIENFLHLTGYGIRTIEDRRNLVKASWIGNQKMSRPRIKALVMAYCGCDSEVHFTHSVSIVMKVSESKSENIYIGDLLGILSAQIPAHLSWQTIMNMQPVSIKVGKSIVYWRYDYEKCGLNPDVSTLGTAIETDYQVESDTQTFIYDYDNSADKTSGMVPEISTIGVATNTDVSVVESTEIYTYDYDNSSDKTSGTVPGVSTVGVTLEKTDTYIYESLKSGSKSSGEEDI